MIRGGSGLLLRVAGVERHVQPGGLQQPDHRDVPERRPRGLHLEPDQRHSGRRVPERHRAAARRSRRASSSDTFKNPYTWQSSIGFQKQLNAVTGIEADLTHYDEYRDTRSIDANLYYNAATGYNALVSAGRPNTGYGQVLAFTSRRPEGSNADIDRALTRRLQKKFQAGADATR